MKGLSEYIPFYKRNLKMAFPVMITQAGQVVVQIADNVMVGHVGTAELAGVSFANSIFIIGMVTLISFAQGLIPLVGQAIGGGNHQLATKYLKNSTIINLIIYTIIGGILLLLGQYLDCFGQKDEVVFFAKKYYYINSISIIPMALFFTSRFFAEGVGNTKYAMWITIISNILNIVLNWVLIFGKCGSPALGVAGAAYATLISRLFCSISFVVVMFCAKELKLFAKEALNTPIEKIRIGEVFSISIPVALTGLMESAAFCFFTVIMVGWIGTVELATHQIVQSLGNISFMVATGIGSATTIRVSHQVGSRNIEGGKMAGIAAIHITLVYMLSCGTIFLLLRDSIPSLFTEDPLVIKAASSLIVVLWFYQIFDAIQLISISALRGLKDTKVPMILSGIAFYVISIPAGYLLGFTLNLGLNGVWWGLALGLIFISILSFTRFKKLISGMSSNR